MNVNLVPARMVETVLMESIVIHVPVWLDMLEPTVKPVSPFNCVGYGLEQMLKLLYRFVIKYFV